MLGTAHQRLQELPPLPARDARDVAEWCSRFTRSKAVSASAWGGVMQLQPQPEEPQSQSNCGEHAEHVLFAPARSEGRSSLDSTSPAEAWASEGSTPSNPPVALKLVDALPDLSPDDEAYSLETYRHRGGAMGPALQARIHAYLTAKGEPSLLPCLDAFVADLTGHPWVAPGQSVVSVCTVMPVCTCDVRAWVAKQAPPPTLSTTSGRGSAAHAAPIGGVPEPLLWRMFLQMMAGVDAVHRHGFVHRAIKLSSFLVGPEPHRVRLAGWGSAFLRGTTPSPGSEVGGREASGSADELRALLLKSPEELDGARVTLAADWWCLGLALYALACGGRGRAWPFKPEAEWTSAELSNVRGTLKSVIRTAALHWPPHITQAVRGLIRLLLDPRPEQRVMSVEGVVTARVHTHRHTRHGHLRARLTPHAAWGPYCIPDAAFEDVAAAFPELAPDMARMLALRHPAHPPRSLLTGPLGPALAARYCIPSVAGTPAVQAHLQLIKVQGVGAGGCASATSARAPVSPATLRGAASAETSRHYRGGSVDFEQACSTQATLHYRGGSVDLGQATSLDRPTPRVTGWLYRSSEQLPSSGPAAAAAATALLNAPYTTLRSLNGTSLPEGDGEPPSPSASGQGGTITSGGGTMTPDSAPTAAGMGGGGSGKLSEMNGCGMGPSSSQSDELAGARSGSSSQADYSHRGGRGGGSPDHARHSRVGPTWLQRLFCGVHPAKTAVRGGEVANI